MALYRGSTAISPHRQQSKSHGELTAAMKTKELAQDVQDAVEQDFTIHCRIAETEKFLNKLLPVPPTTINAILRSMKDQKLYDSQTQRWVGFADPIPPDGESEEESKSPEEKKKKKLQEKSLYDPFTRIAEAIREAAETAVLLPREWAVRNG